MKNSLEDQLNLLIEDAKHDLYKLTMPMLAASNRGRLDIVKELSKTFFKHFAIDEQLPGSYYAWLLSRALFAQPSSEKKLIEKLHRSILELLPEHFVEDDCFTAWTLSYLLLSGYENAKTPLLAAANYVTKFNISNFLWTHIMVAYTTSKNNDEELLQREIQIMLEATEQDTLVNALKQVPLEDFRAWAIALMYTVNPADDLMTELEETLKNPNINLYDRVLASSTLFNT